LLRPEHARRPWGWRLAAPIAFVCAGLLAATSAINAKGTDLRGGRNTSVIGVVSTERSKVQGLRDAVASLQHQVDQLSQNLHGGEIAALQRQLDALGSPVGTRALSGPGIVVTLNDAPRGESVPAGTDPNLLVVHQQDIQAVVNALWAGGAEGISLQGNRIIGTTGIKCVGNTVVLQGVPYSPPYRVVAVGPTTAMYHSLRTSPEVRNYRDYVPPPYNLGWSVRPSSSLDVPAYVGPDTLQYATPLHS
jgi:uncharacterized protein YlxW (UPF0749 family)